MGSEQVEVSERPGRRPVMPALLPAFRIPGDDRRAAVWCSHCQIWHRHSIETGHRVAHCRDRSSPYAETGYVIHVVGTLDDAAVLDNVTGGPRPQRLRLLSCS